MKLINMEVRRDNVRYINPQLFGNRPVYYILTVHVDNILAKYGDVDGLLWQDMKGGFVGNISVAMANLRNTYGAEAVDSYLQERFLWRLQ